MGQRFIVIHYEVKKGVSGKGKAYELPIAMVVLINDDGSQTAGEMLLPRDCQALKIGETYAATHKLVRSNDGKVVAAIDAVQVAAKAAVQKAA